VTPLDPELPPVGEEVHLPAPTILPLLTAIGITLVIVGITFHPIVVSTAGGVLTIVCVIRWIRGTASDIDELPLG
jgi:hypothetical protein